MSATQFISKVIKFFKNYVLHDPVFVMKYGLAYFQKSYAPVAKFFTDEELGDAISSGKSIIRIGDGEIGLMHHRDIHYQKYNADMVSKIISSIEEYNDKSNYILSIPIFVNYTNGDLAHTNGKLSCWLPLKVEFFRRFNPKMKYLDAHFFYRKGFFEDKIANHLQDKKLIINTTENNIIEQRANVEKNFEVIGWIPAKSPDPYDWYDKTVDNIDKCIDEYLSGSDNNKLSDIVLILSSGPMSKVLAYEYAKRGVQALDIGKGFETLYNSVSYEHEI